MPNEPIRLRPRPRGRFAGLRAELRARPYLYGASLGVTLLGPVLARMIFPAEPLSLVIGGGLMLGGFFAFCALANRMFE